MNAETALKLKIYKVNNKKRIGSCIKIIGNYVM